MIVVLGMDRRAVVSRMMQINAPGPGGAVESHVGRSG